MLRLLFNAQPKMIFGKMPNDDTVLSFSSCRIILNKYDVANEKKFKIDILSSRALTQLYTVDKSLPFKEISQLNIDEKVMEIFKKGNKNVGQLIYVFRILYER